MEEIHMELYINEEKRGLCAGPPVQRKRGGSIQRIARNRYLYSGYFYDTNEMLSWIKTFTGRVLHIRGNIPASVQKSQRTGNACIRCTAPEMIRTSIDKKRL